MINEPICVKMTSAIMTLTLSKLSTETMIPQIVAPNYINCALWGILAQNSAKLKNPDFQSQSFRSQSDRSISMKKRTEKIALDTPLATRKTILKLSRIAG